MIPPLHQEFAWLPQDILDDRVTLTKVAMMGGMVAGKGDLALINKIIRSAWALSLRADNVGIPAYEDEWCDYREILIIKAELSQKATVPQISHLQELFHRSVPYPLFLWLERGEDYFLSAVPLRHSRSEKGKELWDAPLARTTCRELAPGFLTVLRPSFSPARNLRDLFFRWVSALYGLMIYSLPWQKILGQSMPFFLPDSLEEGTRAWESFSRLYGEWKTLNAQLNHERQPNHRVTLGNRRFEIREQMSALAGSLSFRTFPE